MRWTHLSQVIIAPHISEKATHLADSARCHVFKVVPNATKRDIHAAIESIFEVEVESVNIVNVKGKKKGLGRHRGRRKNWKKAYVTLVEGNDIQLGGTE